MRTSHGHGTIDSLRRSNGDVCDRHPQWFAPFRGGRTPAPVILAADVEL